MPKQTPEDTTARTPSPRFSTNGFDCELPELARAELLQPKRARMLGRPPAPPPKRSWLDYARAWGHAVMLGLLGLFFIVALCSILSWSASKHAPVPASDPAPTVTPASTPAGTPAIPAAAVRTSPIVEVRRAEFIHPARHPAPAPTQELVDISINTAWRLIMPCDRQEITVTYRGEVTSFSDLPKNPSPNDMYHVTESEHDWVWYQLANFSGPAWVDP
jgi:hypothetical protein